MKELHKMSRNLLFPAFENLTLMSEFLTTKLTYNCTQPQFLLIHNTHLDLVCPFGTCINTVGETISM